MLNINLQKDGINFDELFYSSCKYWNLVPTGIYTYAKAKELLETYNNILDHKINQILSKHSVIYWIHIYRRLSPGPIGNDKRPQSIVLTRAAMEACIQKYGQLYKCDGIEYSNKIKISEIFNGLLLAEQFELERKLIEEEKIGQLVLTKFGREELIDIYTAERIAYELWRVGAMLRILAKGASLIVIHDKPFYIDNRSEDLDFCVRNYDERNHGGDATSTGVWWGKDNSNEDIIFLPFYNAARGKIDAFNDLAKSIFKVKIDPSLSPNFIWYPYAIGKYYKAHKDLSSKFREINSVSLEGIILVIASIGIALFKVSTETSFDHFFHTWMRGYLYPYRSATIKKIINENMSYSLKMLGIKYIDECDIDSAIRFWTLSVENRIKIDTHYFGPHYCFLPVDNETTLLDCAWIGRRLFDLFYSVTISDNNFKGKALEEATRYVDSVLPTKWCKSIKGTRKQIDFAFGLGNCLLIAECKAVAKSIGYDRGDKNAIDYRLKNVIEKSIKEAEDKAAFLVNNPKGTNYDISKYEYILPIGISTFIEFMPSKDKKYWITEEIPRVLTPDELKAFISSNVELERLNNLIKIENK
jgi:hypothetical protein